MDFDLAQQIKNGIAAPLKVDTLEPLKEHEFVSASFLYLMNKAMLLDEMGLGKTISVLGALNLLSKDKKQKVLILSPSSVMGQWSSEISKFLGWTSIQIEGSKAKRGVKYNYFNEISEGVLLTNFSSPLHDLQAYKNMDFTTLVIDEATYVKSPEAQIYSFVEDIGKRVDNIFLLTGTPITLSLGDWYWLFSLLNIDGVVGSFDEEILPLLKYKDSQGRKQVIGANSIDSFEVKIEPYCIKRTMGEVFENSDDKNTFFLKYGKEIDISPLKYSNAQAELFQELKQEANRQARDNSYEPLKTYQKFLQGCSSIRLLKEGYFEPSPKEEYLLNLVQSSEEKVVVYVRYIEFLKCLQNILQVNDIGFNSISGETPIDEREEEKKEFIESDNKVLFITGAGKYGLNLQAASELVLMDVPYSPADFLQIMNRVYRYGQQNKVQIHMVFMENTIEEDIFRKLAKRQEVLDMYSNSNVATLLQREKDFVWGFIEKDYPKLFPEGGN